MRARLTAPYSRHSVLEVAERRNENHSFEFTCTAYKQVVFARLFAFFGFSIVYRERVVDANYCATITSYASINIVYDSCDIQYAHKMAG